MLLRYLGPQPDRTPHIHAGGGPPLRAGATYDVAEILERLGFLMVREPGAPTWPAIGDPLFDVDPHLFETPTTPIEILSCGYQWTVFCSDTLGCLLSNPAEVAAVERATEALEHVDTAKDGESFDAWKARTAPQLPAALARFMYSFGDTPPWEPDTKIYDDVVWPPELTPRVAVVDYHCDGLVRWDMSRAEGERRIVEFLDLIGVRDARPRFLDDDFWHGDGSPRIINEFVTT